MNIKNEIKAYLNYCQHHKKLSLLSIKAYSMDLQQFLNYLNESAEREISKATICRYIQELHQKYPPKTVKRKIASLRAFLNHLEFEEIIETSPMRKVKTRFQEPKQLPKTIPLRFIEQLLTTAAKEQDSTTTEYGSFVALRDRAILETLFATGVRISELCSLKVSDINLDDGTIRIMGKGSKERIIQIGNVEVIASLRQYQKLCNGKSDFFYQSPINTYIRAIGTLHDTTAL